MANFKIKLSDGSSFEIEADKKPTQEQVMALVGQLRAKRTVAKERGFQVDPGPIATAANVSQALQREEAAFAEPILNAIRVKKGPRFGSDPEDLDLVDAFQMGIRGKTFSRFKQGEQAQLGDISRELFPGLPEIVHSTTGLVVSALLPSSLALGGLTGAVGKKIAAKATTTAGKFIAAGEKKAVTLPVANDLTDILTNLEKKAGLGDVKAAEFIESLTGISSEEILYAFRNPQALTRENARLTTVTDLAKEMAFRTKKRLAENPKLFGPDENIPLELAREVTERFKESLDIAGTLVRLAEKKLVGKGVRFNIGELDRSIRRIMGRFLDKNGNLKQIFADDPVALTFQEMRDKLRELRVLRGDTITLDDIFDLKKSIKNIGFKRGSPSFDGIMLPLPEVQGGTQQIYGFIRGLINREFKDFPEVLARFDEFSALADVRGDISRRLGDPAKLAGFIRKIDRKDPEQLLLFEELMGTIPFLRDKVQNSLEVFLNLESTSLRGIFRFLESRNVDEIASEFTKLLQKEIRSPDFTLLQRKGLEALDKVLDLPVVKTFLDHNVAKKFSAKANFFRALAAGGITGLAALPLGPAGTAASALAGFALTDPRLQGALIRRGATATKKVISKTLVGTGEKIETTGKVLEAVAPTAGPAVRRGARQFGPTTVDEELEREALGL